MPTEKKLLQKMKVEDLRRFLLNTSGVVWCVGTVMQGRPMEQRRDDNCLENRKSHQKHFSCVVFSPQIPRESLGMKQDPPP